MRVEVNGTRLFFDVEGAKLVPDGPQMRELPTLILLHGGPGMDHSLFKPGFSQLSDVAQIVYLDHRGQGRSDGADPATWNLRQWGDDVRAFCEALEIEKPIVMGVSFGGMVAMEYAGRHAGHAGALIFCSTAGRFAVERKLDAFERLGGAEAREAARRLWVDGASPETFPDYLRLCVPLYTRRPPDAGMPSRMIMRMETLNHYQGPRGEGTTFNVLAGLRNVQCPVLVMCGEEDPVTTVEDHEEIVAALPAELVRYERFADCGHGVVGDQPRAYDVIGEFIVNQSPRGA